MNNLEKEFEGVELNERQYKTLTKKILKDYHKNHFFTIKKPTKTKKNKKPKDIPIRPKNTSVAKYDFNKINKIYKVTPEITEEKIAEKLRKTKAYKKVQKKRPDKEYKESIFERIKDKFDDILDYVNDNIGKILMVSFIVTSIGFFSNLQINHDKKFNKFQNVYQEKLIQYADYNKDGVITDYEKKEFNLNVLQGKNVFLNGNGTSLTNSSYQDGSGYTSLEELTKWIEDYKPEK